MEPIKISDFDSCLGPYVGKKETLALLLDYDGTLSPLVSHPDLAVLPVEAKQVLEKLSKCRNVFIAVISGRSVENVKQMVGINGITYAGSHGLDIHYGDGSKYLHPLPEAQVDKANEVKKELNDICQNGAWIEDKGSSCTFHYRNVPIEKREPMVSTAEKIIQKSGFKVGIAHCALECKPAVSWDKGRASIQILKTIFGENWSKNVGTIFAGDDVTDEDAMMALKEKAYSFRISDNQQIKTSADKILPSTDSVLLMLKWVEKHMIQ